MKSALPLLAAALALCLPAGPAPADEAAPGFPLWNGRPVHPFCVEEAVYGGAPVDLAACTGAALAPTACAGLGEDAYVIGAACYEFDGLGYEWTVADDDSAIHRPLENEDFGRRAGFAYRPLGQFAGGSALVATRLNRGGNATPESVADIEVADGILSVRWKLERTIWGCDFIHEARLSGPGSADILLTEKPAETALGLGLSLPLDRDDRFADGKFDCAPAFRHLLLAEGEDGPRLTSLGYVAMTDEEMSDLRISPEDCFSESLVALRNAKGADLPPSGNAEARAAYAASCGLRLAETATASLDALVSDDEEGGAWVHFLAPAGSGDAAGIEPGDVILSLDGREVADAAALREILSGLEPGREAAVVIRRGAESLTRKVTLGAAFETTAE
jgi:hypothetical protein